MQHLTQKKKTIFEIVNFNALFKISFLFKALIVYNYKVTNIYKVFQHFETPYMFFGHLAFNGIS